MGISTHYFCDYCGREINSCRESFVVIDLKERDNSNIMNPFTRERKDLLMCKECRDFVARALSKRNPIGEATIMFSSFKTGKGE